MTLDSNLLSGSAVLDLVRAGKGLTALRVSNQVGKKSIIVFSGSYSCTFSISEANYHRRNDPFSIVCPLNNLIGSRVVLPLYIGI